MRSSSRIYTLDVDVAGLHWGGTGWGSLSLGAMFKPGFFSSLLGEGGLLEGRGCVFILNQLVFPVIPGESLVIVNLMSHCRHKVAQSRKSPVAVPMGRSALVGNRDCSGAVCLAETGAHGKLASPLPVRPCLRLSRTREAFKTGCMCCLLLPKPCWANSS